MSTYDLMSSYAIDAALLSEAAYGKDATGTALRIDTLLDKYGLSDDGWVNIGINKLKTYNPLLDGSDFDQQGFFKTKQIFNIDGGEAFVLYNTINHTLSLAFRGTEPEKVGDLYTDLKGGAMDWKLALNSFHELVKSVLAYAGDSLNEVEAVLVTGHSLGGALAEQFLADNYEDNFFGVTFGSPAIKQPAPELGNSLVRFGNTGDFIFNVTPSHATNGTNIVIDRPDLSNETIISLGKIEHPKENYEAEVKEIVDSVFFDKYARDVGLYSITYSGEEAISTVSSGQKFIIGSGSDNIILGNELSDLLDGRGGSDTLLGFNGDDSLAGGDGNDSLDGGLGHDLLVGGLGADTFKLNRQAGAVAGIYDEIADYSASEGDSIDISTFVGPALASGQKLSSLVRARADPAGGRAWLEIKTDVSVEDASWLMIARLDNAVAGAAIGLTVDSLSTSVDQSIIIDGAAGSWTITPDSRTVGESQGELTFVVSRPDKSTSQTVYVSTTVNLGNTNSGDYVPWLNVPVTLGAGQQSCSIIVKIIDDSKSELPETFGLVVQSSASQQAEQYLGAASFTIMDNDAPSGQGAATDGPDQVTFRPTAAGIQSFDGQGGSDRAVMDFSTFTTGVDSRYFSGTSGEYYVGSQPTGYFTWAYEVSLFNVEHFTILGGSGNDQLSGGDGDDVFIGNDGNDGLGGGSGNDVLSGGEGNDNLNAGTGQDSVSGGDGDDSVSATGAGADMLSGGAGKDMLSLDRSDLTEGVTLTFDSASGGFTLPDGTIVSGFELLDLVTGSGPDQVTFRPTAAGIQSFDGQGGSDRAVMDFSTFTTGVDSRYFSGTSGEYYVGSQPTGYFTWAYEVSLFNVEHFTILGGSGNDQLSGGDGDDVFIGNDGNDGLAEAPATTCSQAARVMTTSMRELARIPSQAATAMILCPLLARVPTCSPAEPARICCRLTGAT